LSGPRDGYSIRLILDPAPALPMSAADQFGIMNLLSERVGPDGRVVGVEREPRFFEMARTEQNKRDLRNVQLVNADAVKTGLEKNSYDVVHERLVLINIPLATQQAILTEMLSLLRPSGTIAIEEFDFVSFAFWHLADIA
jgi:ubiquinone/menaquinone biosynthesis C-methylase UbiE